MKFSFQSGTILAALALAGCNPPPEAAEEHAAKSTPRSQQGPASPEPLIVPSPVPSLPETPRGDLDKVEKKDEARPAEPPKAEPGKDEPKAQAPK